MGTLKKVPPSFRIPPNSCTGARTQQCSEDARVVLGPCGASGCHGLITLNPNPKQGLGCHGLIVGAKGGCMVQRSFRWVVSLSKPCTKSNDSNSITLM